MHLLAGLGPMGAFASALALVAALLPPSARAGEVGPVVFGRDVLPILSDACFHCHGNDPGTRQADLRLDTEEGVLRGESPPVVAGQPGESELIARITSRDPLEIMPPPKSNRHLTPEQIDVLRRWVEQGAKWGRHWSFEPPGRPTPPASAGHPIDAFIADRLAREGIVPAPEASRETLIRRATLDLTGLPPTLAEIDAFLADDRIDAFERVVDRLLASPRYGERMAVDWLDLARFADTHGYQADRPRPVWAYRDWVIGAFNRNLPFDQFGTWQLAGDLLPDATREQRLATAFNRLHVQNEEGGIVAEEFRVSYVADRVNTLGTAFLGLTLECARCHDHKYDPITQRDYYGLFALFQNIDESGQTTYFTPATPVPALLLTNDATDAKLADLDRQIASKSDEIARHRAASAGACAEWIAHRTEAPGPPRPVASFDLDAIREGKVANAVDAEHSGVLIESPKLVDGAEGRDRAAALSGEDGFRFPGVGHFTCDDAFSLAIRVRVPGPTERAVVVHHSKAPIDAGSRGYELLIERDRVAFGLHHMWPGNSMKVITRDPIPIGAWAHVVATHDGSGRADGVRIYVDGESRPLDVIRDGLTRNITYEGGEPDLAIGQRFRDNGFAGGLVDDFAVFDRGLAPLEVARLSGRPGLVAELEGSEAARIDEFLAAHSPEAKALADALTGLRKSKSQVIDPTPEIMVMREMDRPRPAFLLQRGAYDAPGDPVEPGTPGALPPFPADQPRNRLGLARWLFDPEHPLTARVVVNRYWRLAFGRGLVESVDNFGSQGATPSHPDLLDWLARDFVASGWDVKRLLRLMVTSDAYRRSSRAEAGARSRDPENLLLSRASARRLSAEMIRDQALSLSGLLAEKIGGPSVRPYQPAGLWEVAMNGPKYEQSRGDDLHRRSLYTFWKRTVPHPAMVAFDAADRSVCIARRQETNTPMQALVLLNDPQIVEAARGIGQKALREGGREEASRIAWTFRLTLGRPPGPSEMAILTRLVDEQRAGFKGDPVSARRYLAVGELPADPGLDPVELASFAVLAQALLGYDEAVMRR
ncbi:DUF1553 domain-containing protein [Tundrisphaera sp. TA3]|uniref:DUF1553 domain-containing protein n=1 Tax=Tundrisphaera sp. TA3 TaxID=3435775 RepID=UPI003EBDCD29